MALRRMQPHLQGVPKKAFEPRSTLIGALPMAGSTVITGGVDFILSGHVRQSETDRPRQQSRAGGPPF